MEKAFNTVLDHAATREDIARGLSYLTSDITVAEAIVDAVYNREDPFDPNEWKHLQSPLELKQTSKIECQKNIFYSMYSSFYT
jgi:hypothetical protein